MNTPPQEHIDWIEARGFIHQEESSNLWKTADGVLQYMYAQGRGPEEYIVWGAHIFNPDGTMKKCYIGRANGHPRGVAFQLYVAPCGKLDDPYFRLQSMTLEPSPEEDRQWLRARGFDLVTEAPEGMGFGIEVWMKPGFDGYLGYVPTPAGDFLWGVYQETDEHAWSPLYSKTIWAEDEPIPFCHKTPAEAVAAQVLFWMATLDKADRKFEKKIKRLTKRHEKEMQRYEDRRLNLKSAFRKRS